VTEAPKQLRQFIQATQIQTNKQTDTDTLHTEQRVRSAIWFLWSERFSTPDMHRQLIELYGDDVTGGQLQNGGTDIRSVSRTHEWRN
jgi:hypothetical protein